MAFLVACGGEGPPPCEPFAEECNDIDDDCDGAIDDNESGGPLRRDCSNVCGPGTEECHDGDWIYCSSPQPMDELCNGFDDDCDGRVDEDCVCEHGDTRPCGTDRGECERGVEHCADGAWGACQQAYDPAEHPELCDGLDNDCDGRIDEGCACEPGTARECGTDDGECEAGSQECLDGGSWAEECEGEEEPTPDVCDGLDNDCDGEVDWIVRSDFGWRRDTFEVNDDCADALDFADVEKDEGWQSLPVPDWSSVLSYPTLLARDDDWYSTRAVERGNCIGLPWSDDDCFLLTVQLELIDRRYVEGAAQRPEDYRLCVATGSCLDAGNPDRFHCTHMTNWREDYSSFLLGLTWGGSCSSDHSRDIQIRVDSPSGDGCGHYQVHVHFDETDC